MQEQAVGTGAVCAGDGAQSDQRCRLLRSVNNICRRMIAAGVAPRSRVPFPVPYYQMIHGVAEKAHMRGPDRDLIKRTHTDPYRSTDSVAAR